MSRRRLGVNVDHVATLRQSRRTRYPDPVAAAAICELAGADQITVHLREDRRHIQERDVRILRQTVQTSLNLEAAATQEMVKIAYDIKPDIITLVPERREELTTEGGLDVARQRDHVKKYVQSLKDADIQVSLFVDPDLDQVRAAHRVEADAVELHTGKYCDSTSDSEQRAELQRIVDAGRTAAKLGMRVAAGHGLNYHNIHNLVPVAEIEEYNIGHAIVAQAVFVGFDRAIRDMVDLLNP
jgi:pyridoxine 5-phosphate synthase